jgi:hypothetical protein
LRITVEGEPVLVFACHCDFCQKRTGSTFGVQCYFSDSQCVAVEGESRVYNGLKADGVGTTTGHSIDYHFCVTCGSTLYWTFDERSDAPEASLIGIAVGNFVDPDFPAPERELYARLRHCWMPQITSAETFETFPDEEARRALLGPFEDS